ncbi:hypothetical protein [Niabella drilacis]|uniref:Uncharacterized protein n=1 Tax=Niabella drilacis (strain DSM 25811 / CCM 8410 / CCUG 62505 / LMG 26954 / E90) TaxID=1285928 RepID=A0A1G7AAA0_NIADE|nr:hypothetical protein [Niabella drilacis]SDE11739.1 hypothetical protein SAMN04487894_12220 [Niabella drilacis]
MKNKNNKDPFKTTCWYGQPIRDPYQVFAGCFSNTSVSFYRDMIRDVLLHVTKVAIYKKTDPAGVYRCFKIIRSVMLAAYLIKNRTGVVLEEALMHRPLYCDEPGDEGYCWTSFPRVLSVEEYKNPYRALRHFFKFQSPQQWKACLQAIPERAYTFFVDPGELEAMDLYLHLVQLMEAAHLINVREVTHVNGRLKPGMYLQNQF